MPKINEDSRAELGVPLTNMLSALIFQKAMKRKDVKGGAPKKEAQRGSTSPLQERGSGSDEEASLIHTPNESTVPGEEGEELEQKTRQGTINLIGVDTQRISMFSVFLFLYPLVLVKISISIVFLTIVIGWQSLLAGILAFLITIPLNIWSSKNYVHCETLLMELRDKKLAVVTEALQGIRQIKFSALEKQWQAKLAEKREKELEVQWTAFKYDSVIIFCYIISPVLLSAACLSTHALLYGNLSPSVAFTTISILGSIEGALSVIPELTSNGIDAWVSIKRINEYLNAPEKENCCEQADRIIFEKADIAWPADEQDFDPDRFILRNVTLEIPPAELTVISGKTGSGKSLLLSSLLGEADKLGGSIYAPLPPPLESRFDSKATKGNWIVDSAVAFVAQVPYIENASIRDNILFGLPYDSGRYNDTIEACALTKDLEMLDDGDSTEIGHNGVNLSGGQRWRVSFARALYSRAGILILDDIFSAVDAHVGRHLFEEALTGPLAIGRTRILVTHHVSLVISKAKYAVHLAEGTVSRAGYVDDLKQTGALDALLKEGNKNRKDKGDKDEELNTTDNGLTKIMSKRSQRSAIIDDGGIDTKSKDTPKKFVEDEKQESGAIKFSVYKNYLVASGGFSWWIPIISCFIFAPAFEVARTWWVTQWTRTYDTQSQRDLMTTKNTIMLQTSLQLDNQSFVQATDAATDGTLYYLSIYLVLSLAMTIFGTLKYLATSMAAIRASRILFDRLAYTILRTPLRWLDTVPVSGINPLSD